LSITPEKKGDSLSAVKVVKATSGKKEKKATQKLTTEAAGPTLDWDTGRRKQLPRVRYLQECQNQ